MEGYMQGVVWQSSPKVIHIKTTFLRDFFRQYNTTNNITYKTRKTHGFTGGFRYVINKILFLCLVHHYN